MQQKKVYCQQVTKSIRDAIRKEAEEVHAAKTGAIKVSFVPNTKEADEFLGGFSDMGHNKVNEAPEDLAVYSYSYALDPETDFAMSGPNSYVDIYVRKGDETFLDITVRVYVDGDKSKVLAKAALPAVKEFFSNLDDSYSVQ
jgi:hypothetical protein